MQRFRHNLPPFTACNQTAVSRAGLIFPYDTKPYSLLHYFIHLCIKHECLVPQPSINIRLPFQDFIFKIFIIYELNFFKLSNWCGSHLVLWSQMALTAAGARSKNVWLLKRVLQVPSIDTFLLNISGSVSTFVVERRRLRFS